MSRCSISFRDNSEGIASSGEPIAVVADSALDLIEWIYLNYPRQALKILRERIVFESAPSSFEESLIKVAAKRWEIGSLPEGARPIDLASVLTMRAQQVEVSRAYFADSIGLKFQSLVSAGQWVAEEARKLRSEALNSEAEKFELDRSVVAAAFDKDFRLIAATRNTNAIVRTRHAEMNLLQAVDLASTVDSVSAPALAAVEHIIVSLQCCRMCAAALPKKKIYFIEPEPALANVQTELFGFEEKLVL